MKRRQFHLSPVEEDILRKLSKTKGVSEAEIVRMAIRNFDKEERKAGNALYRMGINAQMEQGKIPEDLSENHDQYLNGIFEYER